MSHRNLAAALAALVVCAAAPAGAASFAEIGDATDGLPGQAAVGAGTLDSITGSIGFANDADVYRITITDPGSFSARTVGGFPDSQLFLFDLAGMGIAMNDDCSFGCGLRSSLDAGHPLLTGLLAGDYLLAITEYDLDPVDAGNNPIFPDVPFGGVNGPNVGAGALAGWSQGAGPYGSYTIELTGAGFAVPEPSAALLYLAGFGVAGARLRRRARH